jgi:hypothetical protein
MLLLGEQDFAATGHDSLDANSLVMVTLRQATSAMASLVSLTNQPASAKIANALRSGYGHVWASMPSVSLATRPAASYDHLAEHFVDFILRHRDRASPLGGW